MCIYNLIPKAPDLDVGLTNVLAPNLQVVSLAVTYGCYGQTPQIRDHTRVSKTGMMGPESDRKDGLRE